MCKSPLHSFLRALPKAEHHMHLEGALEPSLLFALAEKNNIELPKGDVAFSSEAALLDRYKRFTSLDDFLQYYFIGMSVLMETTDFEALAWEYFQKSFSDGVQHAEVFFDPQAHLSRGIKYSTMLEGFLSAQSRAQRELGMSVELICCFLRHLPVADSLAVFEDTDVQKSFAAGQVIGIGIDSSEVDYPPHLFSEIYSKAAKLNLHRTAHAGEEGPAQFIAGAIDDLGVQRIDHGIRLASDAELMKRVAESGLMLTVCPISNVLLRCAGSVKDVPIRTYLDAGVKFSLNSDDPAYFGAYVLDVYCAVQEAFNLTVKDWETICTNSIDGSWCSEERKSELLGKLATVVTEWKETAITVN
jgi:adenosine deaminase